MSFICYLDDLAKRRRWDIDVALFHQWVPVPPPYLRPHEYARLRVLKRVFELHDQLDVVREIDAFLRYRFCEPEIVAHLLYAGMFDVSDILLADDGTFKEIEGRFGASRSGLTTFRNTKSLLFQEKHRLVGPSFPA
ncbi:hypothetical protein C8R47DRAFT_1210970 [Mycena vitilis]|nr:hypothetical protein C8R47DRAFT_1210970 [Mycena vitilis]